MTDGPSAYPRRLASVDSQAADRGHRSLRVALVNDYPVVIAGLAVLLAPFVARVRIVELNAVRPIARAVDAVLFDAFGSPEGLSPYVERSGAPVVVYSFDNEARVVDHALRVGAAGYVFKGAPTDAVVRALERAAAGRRAVELGEDADLESQVANMAAPFPGRLAGLGHREAEILALICQGLSNQEIADGLYLSVNTVKTYIRSAYRKIGATTRPHAVLWGVHHGFARLPLRLPPNS